MYLRRVKLMGSVILVILLIGVLPMPKCGGSPQQQGLDSRSRRTIIVNASGGGDYTHIQWAIDNASEGNTVYVENGIYCENVTINKSINLIGESRENTVISGVHHFGELIVQPTLTVSSDSISISCFNITGQGTGIFINHSKYITIFNNICNNFYYGIVVSFSNYLNISKNVFRNHESSISISNSNHNNISNNYCCENRGNFYTYTGGTGIALSYSNDNFIINNVCSNNYKQAPEWSYGTGIDLRYSDNNTIINNSCFSNEGVALLLVESSFNNIYYNSFKFNFREGISLRESFNNSIYRNIIENNGWEGIDIYSSNNNNTISQNNIDDYVTDNGFANRWNSSKKGNYWSDYSIKHQNAHNDSIVWDTPYEIAGSANNNDFYPLCEPVKIDPTLPIAIPGNDITIDQHEYAYFDGSKSYDNFGITDYDWSFSYNNEIILLHGATSSFIFHEVGTYYITLSVRNIKGDVDEDVVKVNVLDAEPPIPNAGPDEVIRQGSTFYFDGSNSWDNIYIVNYSWGFAYDSQEYILHGPKPNFTFNLPGTYTITLNVSDEQGNWATDIIIISVTDSVRPVANAGEDVTIHQYEKVMFDAGNSTDNIGIINFTWNFSYDQQDVLLFGKTFSFKFDFASSFVLTLNVSDAEGNWDADSLTVTVVDITPPVANAGPNITIVKNEIFTLNGSKSHDNVGISNYTWSFHISGLNITTYEQEIQLIFHELGDHPIKLRVYDDMSLYGEDTIWVRVLENVKPHADAGSDMTIIVNSTVFLNGSGSYDNVGILNYTWLFEYDGEKVELYGPNASFKFEKAGNHSIVLRVRDGAGNVGEDTIMVSVNPINIDGNEEENDDDDIGKSDKWKLGTYVWLIAISLVFLIAVIGITLHVIPRKKKDKLEESPVDELGRVKKFGEPNDEL